MFSFISDDITMTFTIGAHWGAVVCEFGISKKWCLEGNFKVKNTFVDPSDDQMLP
jgi:hypothetical protein